MLVLLAPGTAIAAGPSATVAAILNTSSTTTLVDGVVSSGNVPASSYDVAYDLGSSSWCSSGGSGSSPRFSTPKRRAQLDPFKSKNVSVRLSRLISGSVYCAALNANPDAQSAQMLFRAGAPNVAAVAATPTSVTRERLSGTVTPMGTATSYWFEWAASRESWCLSDGAMGSPMMTPGRELGSRTSTRHVSGVISGLTPGTSYCWAIVAKNGAGSSIVFPGGDSSTPNFAAGKPTVVTQSATRVTRSGATLHGTINTSGDSLEPKYFFAWDRVGSSFCRSGGKLPPNQAWTFNFATPTQLKSGDTADQVVSARIGRLRPRAKYCFVLVLWSSEPEITNTYTGRLRSFRSQ
jgi:hypothetical protein